MTCDERQVLKLIHDVLLLCKLVGACPGVQAECAYASLRLQVRTRWVRFRSASATTAAQLTHLFDPGLATCSEDAQSASGLPLSSLRSSVSCYPWQRYLCTRPRGVGVPRHVSHIFIWDLGDTQVYRRHTKGLPRCTYRPTCNVLRSLVSGAPVSHRLRVAYLLSFPHTAQGAGAAALRTTRQTAQQELGPTRNGNTHRYQI